MCTGGGGGGGDAAAEARRREEERQARIKAGMSQIDSIFDGGSYGTGEAITDLISLEPGQTYYRPDGSAYTTPGNSQISGQKGRDTMASDLMQGDGMVSRMMQESVGKYEDQLEEQIGADRLYTEQKTAEGFGDDFYEDRKNAYMDFATPQLEDQYQSAAGALTAALSRSGNLRSSLAAQRGSDLSKQFGIQRQNVADQGRGYANQARESVSNARSDAVQMLNASADPDMAVGEALNRVNVARDNQPTFDPLVPAFQNATAGLGGYMQGQRMGDIKRNSDMAYASAPGRSSGRTVRG